MLDQLRQQIQTYLDELLGEVDKLRRALAALGSHDGGAPPSTGATPSTAPERAGRRVRSAPASRTATREPARPRPSTSTATPPASAERAEPPARRRPGAAARTAPGATKTAVLQALSGGDALTAGEVATATGLARGTVSTTLSRLLKSGEVTKAERGYQLAGQPTPGTPTDAAVSAENEQPGG
jgi:DNA-binding transcriptional ArsR family regulator